MSQNYDELENQIGDLGGETSLKGKKLQHRSSYGQQEELSDEEKASLDDFLNKKLKIRLRFHKVGYLLIEMKWVNVPNFTPLLMNFL